ncbi:hypothetical protein KNE206_28470 [Kitasatospora sp. NE20-6]
MIPTSGTFSSVKRRGPLSRHRMIFQLHFSLPRTGSRWPPSAHVPKKSAVSGGRGEAGGGRAADGERIPVMPRTYCGYRRYR